MQVGPVDHVWCHWSTLACKGRQKFVSYCLLQRFQKVADIRGSSCEICPLTCETMCEGRVSSVWLARCKRGQLFHLPDPTRDLLLDMAGNKGSRTQGCSQMCLPFQSDVNSCPLESSDGIITFILLHYQPRLQGILLIPPISARRSHQDLRCARSPQAAESSAYHTCLMLRLIDSGSVAGWLWHTWPWPRDLPALYLLLTSKFLHQ